MKIYTDDKNVIVMFNDKIVFKKPKTQSNISRAIDFADKLSIV